MARWKNINGVLQKIAGSVRIDQVLNKLSRNAISNKAVSEKFEEVDSKIDEVNTTLSSKTSKTILARFTPSSVSVTYGAALTALREQIDFSTIANHDNIYLKYSTYRYTANYITSDGLGICKTTIGSGGTRVDAFSIYPSAACTYTRQEGGSASANYTNNTIGRVDEWIIYAID